MLSRIMCSRRRSMNGLLSVHRYHAACLDDFWFGTSSFFCLDLAGEQGFDQSSHLATAKDLSQLLPKLQMPVLG